MENATQEEVIEATEETVEEGKAKRDKADCSHRVIEKRRRDRINNSLLQLSKLVPVEKFNKKNSGKLEKAEILEVTVQYLIQQKRLQEQKKEENENLSANNKANEDQSQSNYMTAFLHGFKECIGDATKFFQEVEELDVSEGRCHRLIQHLKKQVQQYESNEREPSKGVGDGRIWEGDDSKKTYNTITVEDESGNVQSTVRTENTKRKNSEILLNAKKQRLEPSPADAQADGNIAPSESDLPSNTNTESSNGGRNFMPFMFPNVPFFPAFSFPGANGMPRYQTPQAQYPGYGFPQSAAQYFPVALPQFPYMGMNFMSGFGMVNPDSEQQQQQSNGMNHSMSNGIQNGMTNGVPNGVVNGMMNNFLPSMYTNGIHANLLAMRPRDSGYESSERSSSKESRSETSPPSFSDDSCQSFVT